MRTLLIKTSATLIAIFVANILLAPLYVVCVLSSFVACFIPMAPTKIATKNLKERLNLNAWQIKMTLFGVYLNYWMYVVENFILLPLGLIYFKEIEETVPFLTQVCEKYGTEAKPGFLVLGAHYANFELCGFLVSRRIKKHFGKEMYAFTKAAKVPFVNAFWGWYRPKMGFNIILTNRKDRMQALDAVAKNGSCLALIADHKQKTATVFIRFFGSFAVFPTKGVEVALNNRMPIVHLGCRRIFPGIHQFHFSEGYNPHLTAKAGFKFLGNTQWMRSEIYKSATATEYAQEAEVMAAFAGWLELIIRKKSSQWFWNYKKWSRQPV